MSTRQSDTLKAVAKSTPPPAKRATAKPHLSAEPHVDSSPMATVTPEAVGPTPASAGRPIKVGIAPNSEPELSVEPVSQISKVAKSVSGKKVVKKLVRKVIRKAVGAPRTVSACTTSGAVGKANIDQTTEERTVNDKKEVEAGNDGPAADDISFYQNVKNSVLEDENIDNFRGTSKREEQEADEPKNYVIESGGEFVEATDSIVPYEKHVDAQEPILTNEKYELRVEKESQVEITEKEDLKGKTIEVDDASDVKLENTSIEELDGEKIEALSDQEVHEEFEGEDLADDDGLENEAGTETLEEEQVQLNAVARERKVRKEREIFVGGLDRDALEDDVRKVFEYAGEVVEVRMHVDLSTNKNKGYAFVQFATKEQAKHALSEMKNPVIRGKRCGTAASEDNNTLFLGNICNTWTKDAIKQKLKDYGVEGVENITLVADPRHEGLSRGFAFVEFFTHNEAMLAYKRLQKPDVVFGHSERTAKVAFSEPLREPDPEVMAHVKSVFIDGLPPTWGEDHVREKFRVFGEIARIMLARNMSTAKRKDFGFVDFNTHEAAVSCVEGVNSKGLNDDNTKVKVRARLSNPLPKMQAVKSGMCGGFRIGHGSSGTFPRFSDRGFGRGGRPYNRYGRGSHPCGPGHSGRMSFNSEPEYDYPYPPFPGRPSFGRGGRWSSRGAHQGPLPGGPYPPRVRHGATDRGYGDYDSYRRYPYSYEEGYDRSFMGRHFDDPYPYDDVGHGIKRPHYMMEQDPNLAEPSRYRSRFAQSDPAVPFRGTRYREELGADGGLYRQNFNGPPRYGGSSYSAFYGDDHSYGRSYYY